MQNLNVMLVESSRLWRGFLVSTFEELGFEVFEAHDESSALQVLESMREHGVKLAAIFSNATNLGKQTDNQIPIFPVPSPDEVLTPLREQALKLKASTRE